MDDESGWNAILVEGWGELVRAAVCDRVEQAMEASRGVLAVAVATPDEAPAPAVERVHDAVLAAIAAETGADLDELGSQAAWATYDDVWGELGRRWSGDNGMERIDAGAEATVRVLLAGLPRPAIEHAGAVVEGLDVRLIHSDGDPCLDVDGIFRWLASDEADDEALRQRARQVVAIARRPR